MCYYNSKTTSFQPEICDMRRPLLLLLPGLCLGITFLMIFVSLVTVNESAQASAIPVTGSSPASPTTSPAQTQPSSESSKPASASDCSLPARYPTSIHQWCALIEQEAQKNGVDPRLVAAVMLQESGGNARAYSKSGAVGLMQVMPRDGIAANFKCVNGPCFASRPSMAQLYDPEFNVSYGVKMLAGLIKKYGNPRDALKAYGPADSGYTYADKVLAIYNNYR